VVLWAFKNVEDHPKNLWGSLEHSMIYGVNEMRAILENDQVYRRIHDDGEWVEELLAP
jgi:hypothetical protein